MRRSVPEGPVDSLALERPEVLVEGPVQALRLPVAGLLPPRVHPAALGPDRFLHPLNCRSRLAARHQLMGHGPVYVKVRGLREDVLPAEAPAGLGNEERVRIIRQVQRLAGGIPSLR